MARKNLMKGFKRPKNNFEQIEHSLTYGKFAVAPFEPGFGTTVGTFFYSRICDNCG